MLFANDYNDNRIHIDETHSNQRTYARSDIPCRKVGGRNKRRFAGRAGCSSPDSPVFAFYCDILRKRMDFLYA